MASEQQNGGAGICHPCRGTGQLISGLGGEPHQVICPWCRGTGQRIPGIDAQQSPAEAGAPVDAGAAPDAG
jgi:DnaJ-class molecular chaperone